MNLSQQQINEFISTIEEILENFASHSHEIIEKDAPYSYYKKAESFYKGILKYAKDYFNGETPTNIPKPCSYQFEELIAWYEVLRLAWENLSSTIELPFKSPFEGLIFKLKMDAKATIYAMEEATKKPLSKAVFDAGSLKNKYNRKGELTKSEQKKFNSVTKRLAKPIPNICREAERLELEIIAFASEDKNAKDQAEEYQRIRAQATEHLRYRTHPDRNRKKH